MDFSVDPDVRRARTPDKALYLDPAMWARTRERVFARCWQRFRCRPRANR